MVRHVPGPGDRQASGNGGDGNETDTEDSNSDLPWWGAKVGASEMRVSAGSMPDLNAPEGRGGWILALPAGGWPSTFSASTATGMERETNG